MPLLLFFLALLLLATPVKAQNNTAPAHAPQQNWSFSGLGGYFDLSSVQRGYLVYKKTCASCHTLSQVHFSDFLQMGLTKKQVSELASSWNVVDHNDDLGHPQFRHASSSDRIPSPYLNISAAKKANFGVIPPDLSRMTEIYPGGADRIYAFLLSFSKEGGHQPPWYNPYVIGHLTAMAPPFTPDHLRNCQNKTSFDNTCQQAKDVTTFIAWISNPAHDEKKRFGIEAGFYLLFIILLAAILKRRIWSHVKK